MTIHSELESSDDFGRQITLLELIDRLIGKGVVLHGDITLAVADIDLIYVGLRALISSVSTLEEQEIASR